MRPVQWAQGTMAGLDQYHWTVGAGVPVDGAGSWDALTPNWINGIPGFPQNAVWQEGNTAVIGGGGSGWSGTAGTVTVAGTQMPDSLNVSPAADGTDYSLSGGTLTVNSAISLNVHTSSTISTALGGPASLTLAGGGTLALSGTNTYTGSTTINGGTVQLAQGSGGTYAGMLAFTGTGNCALNTGGNNQTFGGLSFGQNIKGTNATVTGGGSLTISGSTQAVLASSVNGDGYTQTFSIAGGTNVTIPNLLLGSDSSSSQSYNHANLNVQDGATLTVGTLYSAYNHYTGGANSPGSFAVLTIANATLNVPTFYFGCGTRNSGYDASGTTLNINAGGVVLAGTITNAQQSTPASQGGAIIALNGGTLGNLNAATNLSIVNPSAQNPITMQLLAGGGTIAITPGASATIAPVISGAGALVISGGGKVTLTGANTWSGATTVSHGTLAVNGTIASPVWNIAVSPVPDAMNSGLLDFTAAAIMPALAGTTINILIAETGTGVNWKAVSWSGTPTGSPTLQVNGAPVMSGVATPGGTTVMFTASGISVIR